MNIQHYDADTHEVSRLGTLAALYTDLRACERERDEARKHANIEFVEANRLRDQLRSAVPIWVTDCEKAVREIVDPNGANWSLDQDERQQTALAILRKHSRSLSVGEIAEAIDGGLSLESQAQAVLSLLGGEGASR